MDQDKELIFECPYTWDMFEFIESEVDVNVDNLDLENEDDLFVVKLVKRLMLICEGVVLKDYALAEENIEKVIQLKSDVNEKNLDDGQISLKVVNHIIDSTLYLSLIALDRVEEAGWFENVIEPVNLNNNFEHSSLLGCKSLVWSKYFEKGAKKSVFFANQAKELHPECSIWYYIVALNMRRIRRSDGFNLPSLIECSNFRTAYEISRNPIYGVSLALCYKESKHHDKAFELYQSLKKENIHHVTVCCKLAHGLMYYEDYKAAEECLNHAQQINPNASILLHYKGLFFMKLNRFDEAKFYLKKAGDHDNFRAEINYIECCYKSQPNYNLIDLFMKLFAKYDSEKDHLHIWLYIGMYYYTQLEDIDNTLQSFERAVLINPNCGLLYNFYSFITRSQVNIYHLLEDEVLPVANDQFDLLSRNARGAFNTLCDYTNLYHKNGISLMHHFNNMHV